MWYMYSGIWLLIAIISAVYIWMHTKGKDRILWTILGFLLGIIGWLIWRLAGPGK